MTQSEQRPPIWVGHVVLRVADVEASKAFFVKLGMRALEPDASVGILELRGGTHLVILPTDQPVAQDAQSSFDLMVEDIEATHASYLEIGIDPSPMTTSNVHTSFEIREPGGHLITVNSTHVSDQPV
ncbi:MAG: VOC family protein [Gammaproteobacteria bacterium]|nr:VOC family protein [Gammaproteobacteria bacterium]MCZ6854770.1 VOC family protein [Gammaproteobacteria bacterium]